MNRQEFMRRLEQLLDGIPEEEKRDAIAYYTSYFEDAGEENEEKIIRELESPEKVAATIRADFPGCNNSETASSGNQQNYRRTIWNCSRLCDRWNSGSRCSNYNFGNRSNFLRFYFYGSRTSDACNWIMCGRTSGSGMW